jgi:hypothetical protein
MSVRPTGTDTWIACLRVWAGMVGSLLAGPPDRHVSSCGVAGRPPACRCAVIRRRRRQGEGAVDGRPIRLSAGSRRIAIHSPVRFDVDPGTFHDLAAVGGDRRQQLRLRLAVGQPTTVVLRWVEPGRPPPPGRAGPGVPHRARHPGQPQPRQPRLRPAGWLAGVIEGVFGPEARAGQAVSAGRRAEGSRREVLAAV